MRYAQFFLSLFFASTISLFASSHPSPGRFQLTGEYLYLKPSFDDTYFVIVSPTVETDFIEGTRENNDFGFHSGFRVGVGYGFCDDGQELLIYYSRLHANESKTIAGDFLWPIVGDADFVSNFGQFPGQATSSLDVLYQRVDGFFAKEVLDCCRVNLYLMAGLEYAYARLFETITYVNDGSLDIGQVYQKSKASGIGPQFGFDVNYEICQFHSCNYPSRLSLTGYFTGSILASHSDAAINDLLVGDIDLTNIKDQTTWRLIPAFHSRLGLKYLADLFCFGASLEIGYEFNTYLRGLTRIEIPNTVEVGIGSPVYSSYYNFDIQGLYLAGSITF